jgi:2-oxoglutarate/2-oxoacid ferredoxin oxidoreductase subunit alpha
VMSGSEAMALGALAANVRMVTGYPMSPATPILEYCSRHAERAGVVVEQTEDEVAAINMAIGAAFAGARAMTCTAGGGFALMNEGLSLAGMTETPVVVCVGMRPGPGTGLATRTAQADLLFAIYAGHGEFARAVLTPSDATEAFRAVSQAFHLAEKYQSPVIVLFDQFMGDALWTVEEGALGPVAWQRFDAGEKWRTSEPYSYQRYAPGPDGVSARILPGLENQVVYVDSDEHTEEGHITESAAVRVRMVDKRNARLAVMARELTPPALEPAGDADAVVCCFGSTRGIVAEAVARLRSRYPGLAMLHLAHCWPFPAEAISALMREAHTVLTVEGNYTGQLAQLLVQECGLRVAGTVRRFDGRQFSVAEVEQGIAGYLEGGGDGA